MKFNKLNFWLFVSWVAATITFFYLIALIIDGNVDNIDWIILSMFAWIFSYYFTKDKPILELE